MEQKEQPQLSKDSGDSDEVPKCKWFKLGEAYDWLHSISKLVGKSNAKENDLNSFKKERLRSDPTLLTFLSPEQVMGFIESEAAQTALKCCFLYWRILGVGTYKVDRQSVQIPEEIPLIMVTRYGFVFTLPKAKTENQLVTFCIPISEVVNFAIHFGKNVPLLAIKTGTNYANNYLRQILNLDDCPETIFNAPSEQFYCPLVGDKHWIMIALKDLPEEDIWRIKCIFPVTNFNEGFGFREIDERLAVACLVSYKIPYNKQ